jgi:hypothetical protein
MKTPVEMSNVGSFWQAAVDNQVGKEGAILARDS